jgi:hypothetical protein
VEKKSTLQSSQLWILLTMICWGVYGPILGKAGVQFGGSSSLTIAMVGFGYVVLGVIGGLALLATGVVPDKGTWNRPAFVKGIFAGLLGVAGNLALIIALKLYHRPEVVMPLLFGGVQLGNTVATCLEMKAWPKKGFAFGVILLIVGVVTALTYRPGAVHAEEQMNWWFLAFVAVVWVCWGKYGVQVHAATMAFGKSGIRSMVALSIAYGVVAFLGGSIVYLLGVEPNAEFTQAGFKLGIVAGLITTLGAWGVVFGNRYVKGGPTVVMPLVFAGAPVVNSFFVMSTNDVTWSAVDPRFWLGLLVIVAGGYMVLSNKPQH